MPIKQGKFEPNYCNVAMAARNHPVKRLPLYEHFVCDAVMEAVTGKNFHSLINGDINDKTEYFKEVCAFWMSLGYDTVSYECCIGGIMPDSGCLGGHRQSVISNYSDFIRYPWDNIPDLYFNAFGDHFEGLRRALPPGMKAVGGVGNGIFECVQDVLGYMNMCYIKSDDPKLYEDIFHKVGDVVLEIWNRFLPLYGDIYCVLRFGDDLGYKSNTLISSDDIRRLVVPAYKRVIEGVHAHGKPFLLHSCGAIFDVMPDMIGTAKIDAKHSNEDQIAPFPEWVRSYGKDIALFGGIDTDAICRLSCAEIGEYVNDVLDRCAALGSSGIAFGSGNSIPDYVPVDKYVAMTEAVVRYRGDK